MSVLSIAECSCRSHWAFQRQISIV